MNAQDKELVEIIDDAHDLKNRIWWFLDTYRPEGHEKIKGAMHILLYNLEDLDL